MDSTDLARLETSVVSCTAPRRCPVPKVALVREKYRKTGSMSPNEMALLYNDLYGALLAATHSALNTMIDAAAARSDADR